MRTCGYTYIRLKKKPTQIKTCYKTKSPLSNDKGSIATEHSPNTKPSKYKASEYLRVIHEKRYSKSSKGLDPFSLTIDRSDRKLKRKCRVTGWNCSLD